VVTLTVYGSRADGRPLQGSVTFTVTDPPNRDSCLNPGTTIRFFPSAIFADAQTEHDATRECDSPKLCTPCAEQGFHQQPIDLWWLIMG
jgi:hypothetical protein